MPKRCRSSTQRSSRHRQIPDPHWRLSRWAGIVGVDDESVARVCSIGRCHDSVARDLGEDRCSRNLGDFRVNVYHREDCAFEVVALPLNFTSRRRSRPYGLPLLRKSTESGCTLIAKARPLQGLRLNIDLTVQKDSKQSSQMLEEIILASTNTKSRLHACQLYSKALGYTSDGLPDGGTYE